MPTPRLTDGELTHDWMASQLLGHQRCITAQKDGNWRNALASVHLTNLIHLTRVEGAVSTCTFAVILDFGLRVLFPCEPGISKPSSSFLDRVVEAAPEKDQALTGNLPTGSGSA